MKALKVLLLCALLPLAAKADWTNWRPDHIDGKLTSYHRLNDEELSNGGYKHFIQFKNVRGYKIHIYSAICNNSATSGWCELGPDIQEYGFTLEDDNDSSNWTWTSEILN